MNNKFLPRAVLFIIAFLLSSLVPLAQVKAQNTFYGDGAGYHTTTGTNDSAFGVEAFYYNTSGSENMAIGRRALANNIDGQSNTANGAEALYSNTNGNSNTASGYQALFSNTTGHHNTASGLYGLRANTTGNYNTVSGEEALYSNTIGNNNTASGSAALYDNMTGSQNTASGAAALFNNTTGSYNAASGYQALLSNTAGGFNAANGALVLYSNITGNFNTAAGTGALFSNTTGSNNVAIGITAGFALTTGSGNVCIGAGVNGVAGESNTTRIRNVYTTVANGRAVYVNADNKIGTLSSSRRFKHDIQPMDRSSETLFALKPVTFRYKKDADPSQALSFGLIAEEVAQVSPELITLDEKGKPQTVRYEAVNAMLLNEFLKQHRMVQEQGAMIAEFQKEIGVLKAGLQRVGAQVEISRPRPQMASNKTD